MFITHCTYTFQAYRFEKHLKSSPLPLSKESIFYLELDSAIQAKESIPKKKQSI
jgi:hypothetical protein